MTQRQRAFGHPFAFEFKRLAYEAVKHKKRSFENTMHESAIGTLFAFIGAKRKTYARIELFRFGPVTVVWSDRTFPNHLAQFLIAVAASPVVAATKI